MSKIKDKIKNVVGKIKKPIPALNKVKGYGDYNKAKVGDDEKVVLTNWNSDEGKRRLFRAEYNQAFFRLAHLYQPQLNPFYAAVACIVTTLNTLRVEKGTIPNQEGFDYVDDNGKEYHYTLYSQLTLLNDKTDRVKKKTDIAPSLLPSNKRLEKDFNPGLSLYQMMHILQIYDADVEMQYADKDDEENIDTFVQRLKDDLNNADKLIITNFDGEVIGLSTGGHFSVIGAYDQASESVLVLDTAAHKNPWYWVPVNHLYHAMHTKHGENFRGYLIVKDEKK